MHMYAKLSADPFFISKEVLDNTTLRWKFDLAQRFDPDWKSPNQATDDPSAHYEFSRALGLSEEEARNFAYGSD